MSASTAKTTTSPENEEDVDNPWTDLNLDDDELHRLLDAPLHSQDQTRLRTAAQHEGFDNNVADTWLYPTNLPQRAYQYSISHTALYRNTLVVLPTGLGKTFIAAVVMYNIYRWYPRGKVIFMAPTRPLVAQQIDACQRIMPFPNDETVELTGKLAPARRTELWRTKRVFFATPQVVRSDILGGEATEALDFPFSQVKLLVVDEAHKAKGRYAYTEVTQAIMQRNPYFRVLALSATPGRTVEDVAEVVRNLLISHLEVRWDTSIDVAPYVHKRTMRTVVVPLGDDIRTAYDELLQIIDPYLRQLIDAEVLGGNSHPAQMNRNFLLFEQKRFREQSQQHRHPQHSAVTSNFAICISLYHALELLERHGLRVFLNNFEEDDEGRDKFVVKMDRRLRTLLERLRAELGPNPFDVSAHAMTNGQVAEMPANLDFGHPKFEQARACLLAHFQENPDSRAIIFCEYRESVMLIYRMLLQHKPLLKPRCFVGQGGTTGSLRALTQKQQIQIMNDFRAGTSNILVATSIGEEGIDVGEVELIVCFDISTSNPTRFIQRIGRTGRRKNGNVVMLVTEGREQQLLKDVLGSKDTTNKKLLRSVVIQRDLYKHAPRLVPTEYNPQCVHTFIKPPVKENVVEEIKESSKKVKGKLTSKAPLKGSQDLRKFFRKPNLQAPLDAEDMEIFQMCTRPTQAPSTQTQKNSEKSRHKIDSFFKGLDLPTIMPVTDTQVPSKQTQQKSLNKSNDSDMPDIFPTPNTQVPSTQKSIDSKPLCKTNKLLETVALMPSLNLIEDVWDQLRSKEHSRESKVLLLKQKPELIRKARDRMEIVTAVAADDAVDAMSKEEQNIRENYQIVEELCGGSKEALTDFLEDLDPYTDEITDEEAIQEEADFMACVERIFANGPAPDPSIDNTDYIQQELKKSKRYQEIMNAAPKTPPPVAESMVYDTLLETETLFDSDVNISESKYCSQWHEFENIKLPNRSTPMHGPLVRAFKRQKTKVKSSHLLQRLEESHESSEEHIEIQNDVIFMSDEENILGNIEIPHVENFNSDKKIAEKFEINRVIKKSDSNVSEENLVKSPVNIELNAEKPKSVISLSEENDSELLKNNELVTNPSSSRPLIKIENNSKIVTITNNDTTPEDLDLSLHKLSTVLIKHAAASSPNLDTKRTKNLMKVKETHHEEKNSLLSELDFDMDEFLEPFPEEEMLVANSTKVPEVTKLTNAPENIVTSNRLLAPKVEMRQSPDLFSWDDASPIKANNKTPPKLSLAAKLAAKAARAPISTIQLQTPPKHTATVIKTAVTPTSQPIAQSQKYETSPSIFDMYLKHTRRRGAPTSTVKTPLAILAGDKTDNCNSPGDDIVLRKPHARKRKIFDSDSENEQNQCDIVELLTEKSESDGEEIAATQQKRRKKRRHLVANSFLHQEAAVSGSDQSEDEGEHTLGHYVHDSVIVSSEGEPEPDAASTSHQQAMYLQSLKSPVQRRGAFKIPTFRVYNDHSHIYSQAVPVEASQYLPNSFIVNEEDDDVINSPPQSDVTLCPLERAEKILKERRRAKRQFAKVAVVNTRKKRKVNRLAGDDPSTDDDFY